ncbi:MAG: sulfatase-like hydrolase/transferase [Myxococcaceae bacterium]|nr:sulfatase-like hydrolase/transferase [Myxococcaceae bacterium]
MIGPLGVPRPRPSLHGSALAGALVGLGLFAAEGARVLGESAIGLDIDVSGPFAALIRIVRPLLLPLLARIALAYVAAGILGGLYAALLARLWPIRRAVVAWIVWCLELVAVIAFVVVDHAIVRPALFDDLPAARSALAWLVDHGEPAVARACAGAFLGVQILLAFLLRRAFWPGWRSRARFVAGAACTVAFAFTPWANTFGDAGFTPTGARHAPASDKAPARPRLIVLIGIDAFRPDRLGRGIAPHLEAFLKDATVFENAWTPIAQTEPAWRSLLTARWPTRTGLRYPLEAESRWLPAAMFPARLHEAGFSTTFATDCSRFNYQTAGSGFVHRRQPPRGALNFVLEKLRFRMLGVFADNALGAFALPELMENRALAGLYDPAGYARRLSEEMVARAQEGPAFFAFHATASHFPGDPTWPFYRRYVRANAPLDRRLRMYFSPIAAGARPVEGWDRADAEALYDELIAQADAQLGVLFGALERAGLYDDAAIIVFSDHGESFHADHPELAGATPVHGARISEEENRILLAVKLPAASGAHAPRRSDALVRLIDLGPTVLELAGAPPLTDVDGVSLLPLLEGRPLPAQWLYAESGFTHASPGAFDPGHLAIAPRSFEIYRVRPDGVVEITDEAHTAFLREKDLAAFDGTTWIRRSPRADGSIEETCSGRCPAPELEAWLSARLQAEAPASPQRAAAPAPPGPPPN